jgi:ribosomal protein L11 methyltransferase
MPAHIQVTFTELQPEQQDVLIAHLAEAGFEGFEQDDQVLKAFINESDYDKKLLRELGFKYQLEFSEERIPEQNWNAAWESSFEPVVIDDFLAIRAHFHPSVKSVQEEIIITPKMSFGTGHHETTCMMTQQMRQIDFTGKRVFDFGTGTGVLAILAEKLGASAVVATDNDDWSIRNAIENIQLNHCSKISVERSEEIPAGPFDIILANINRNVILDNFSTFIVQLPPQGVLLISGLLTGDIPLILEMTRSFSLELSGKIEKNNWVCLRFTR